MDGCCLWSHAFRRERGNRRKKENLDDRGLEGRRATETTFQFSEAVWMLTRYPIALQASLCPSFDFILEIGSCDYFPDVNAVTLPSQFQYSLSSRYGVESTFPAHLINFPAPLLLSYFSLAPPLNVPHSRHTTSPSSFFSLSHISISLPPSPPWLSPLPHFFVSSLSPLSLSLPLHTSNHPFFSVLPKNSIRKSQSKGPFTPPPQKNQKKTQKHRLSQFFSGLRVRIHKART